jgi:Fe-S oxidoreductase
MATYKAEFLAHHYAHRLRPRADYAMGFLPDLARLVERLRLANGANAAARVPWVRRAATRAAGLEDRQLPEFTEESLQQWWARRRPRPPGSRGTVLLWPDTFTNRFHPEVGRAAVAVLEDAGWTVTIPPPSASLCCGLTWISTGQLATAKRRLRRTVDALAPHVRAGGLVVGLEPSCTTVFRSDAVELLHENQDVHRLRDRTVTLAELLTEHTPGWRPPRLDGARGVAQVHCHQHAVLGWDADAKLLHEAGAEVERLDSGCCGLAGNFGFTAGHGDVSRALADQVLIPRLRDEGPDTVVLADGFSCRTQIDELDPAGHTGLHLAQLLAQGLPTHDAPDHEGASR